VTGKGVEVENRNSAATLLPYLNPAGATCYLKMSFRKEDDSVTETAFPFLVLCESDPLTRLIEAKMVTDGGSEIERLFLLLQKDGYFLPKDSLWPINNHTVDELWQKGFSFFAGGRADRDAFVFSNQIGEQGKLRPLQSLFFCRIANLFFAPPCPRCGFPLEQCYDDHLLTRWGLQGYSVSLKRYLYCPFCCEEKGSRFYVYELDTSEPPGVGDRWTLIKDFGFLLKSRGKISTFPCSACSRSPECYGPEFLALSRIVPFSFYPFYMFAFRALSLHALDFLPLLSGASIEEVKVELKAKQEWGRIRSLGGLEQDGHGRPPFLFDKDERFFLEVLYLKLSFLGELIRGSFSARDGYRHPSLPLSIDGTWVEFGSHTGLLPFFWNFRVKFLGLGALPDEVQSFPRLPASYGLYSSGLAWFYSLLVNKKMEMSMIHPILKEAVDRSLSDNDFSFEQYMRLKGSPSPFLPVNLFWNPDGKVVREDWYPLWGKSLLLGWSLLRAGLQYDRDWQREEFLQQLEALREDVKGRLFREPIGVSPVRLPDSRTDDEAIYGILIGLLRKWVPGGELEEEVVKETVVLARGGKAALPPLPPEAGEIQEIMRETVVFTSSKEAHEEESFSREAEEPSHVRRMAEQPSEQDFSTETVILGPAGIGSPSMGAGLNEKVRSGSEMEKTVVLGRTGQEPGEDDFLAETVVVETGKGREKKEKRGQ